MPEPIYKGEASTWKQQRGTSFGTNEEGTDYVDLVYRGKSELAIMFRTQWTKGATCPEPGFSHCKLITPPEIREDGVAFSTATLRFEGPSPLSGTVDGTDATITHETQEAEFILYTRVFKGGKYQTSSDAVYRYHRVVMTASYTSTTRPSGVTRYDTDLDHDPDPIPVADVKVPSGGALFSDLKKDSNYFVKKWHVIKDWTESAPGVYEVNEEHCKFLIGGEVTVNN